MKKNCKICGRFMESIYVKDNDKLCQPCYIEATLVISVSYIIDNYTNKKGKSFKHMVEDLYLDILEDPDLLYSINPALLKDRKPT